MSQARARYQAALSGRDGGAILTPWDQLNNLTRGFTADEVVILASESKMGKSMWLGELILYVAWCYGQVEVFAAEMGEFKTYSRLLALISGISAGRQREAARAACGEGSRSQMFTLRESTRMASAMTYLDGLPITIHEDAMSAQDIVAHCRASNRRKKLRSVIVDTFGAVRHERVKGQAKTDSLEESIKALKFGAKEVQAPFFVAHHLNRGARTSGRPTADNLRDGGNLDGWASSVLFLHKENHEHMLIVDRCRDGTPGVIPNSFDGSRALWWETGLEPWHPLDFHQDELAIDDGSLAV
jgi:replicative DNA helicase